MLTGGGKKFTIWVKIGEIGGGREGTHIANTEKRMTYQEEM